MKAGLSEDEARLRLARDGPNRLQAEAGTPAWRTLLHQFNSPLVALLFVGAALSLALGERIDAAAILTILVANAVVGFSQEHRAERALAALRDLTAPRARVRRDGQARLLPATALVVGSAAVGGRRSGTADARLVDAHALMTEEAALTGESEPVRKSTLQSASDAPLYARQDFVFMGTAVAAGTGEAEVVATGMDTQMGHIAHLLATARPGDTPLQARLARLSRVLLMLSLGVVALTAGLLALRGTPLLELFMVAVSLAVAAVPEGLPAVVTVAQAVGVRRMAARQALVRRLPVVETLGSVSVICTDKTGTLTRGRMALSQLDGPDEAALLAAAVACCDAELAPGASPEDPSGTGDPTELAILALGAARGLHRPDVEARLPRTAHQPFDADLRRMAVRRSDGLWRIKGAPEVLIADASLDEAAVEAWRQRAEVMGAAGLRVLAVAMGTGDGDQPEQLTLLGLLGFLDPPRAGVAEAVAEARSAGITTVMITGDQQSTAEAIARSVGLLLPGEDPTGRVYARADPSDKLRIIQDWSDRGAVVAMTGDGVNDAPAVRRAHVGIAMGRTGTEVTREAADLVLADDNYATLIHGVREGRAVYDNIRKVVIYLLAGNLGELSTVALSLAIGLPLPVLPLQLLWINLVTDGAPALALALDPPAEDTMKRPPRPPGEEILGAPQWRRVVAVGLVEGVACTALFAWASQARDLDTARDLVFTSLVVAQVVLAFGLRSPRAAAWRHLGRNRWLLLAVAFSALAQVLIHLLPPFALALHLTPLRAGDVGLAVLSGITPLLALELGKLVLRVKEAARG